MSTPKKISLIIAVVIIIGMAYFNIPEPIQKNEAVLVDEPDVKKDIDIENEIENPEPKVIADIVAPEGDLDCSTFPELVKQAEGNDPESMYKVGIAFYRGQCTHHSFELAYSWFTSAAMKEHVDAYYNSGFMMHRSLGVPSNRDYLERGFTIITDLAAQGYQPAIDYLSEIDYSKIEGHLGKPDPEKYVPSTAKKPATTQ